MEKQYIVCNDRRGCVKFCWWFGFGASLAAAVSLRLHRLGLGGLLSAAIFLAMIVAWQLSPFIVGGRRK